MKNKTSKQLLWVGIMGIVMFFAGLTSAYIVRKSEGNWFLWELPSYFLYSTIVILLSSILLVIAVRRIRLGEQNIFFVFGALIYIIYSYIYYIYINRYLYISKYYIYSIVIYK